MKKYLLSCLFLFVILTACNKPDSTMNIYVSLSGETDHWEVTGYEIAQTPEAFKVGNGTLKIKNTDKTHMGSFISFDTYIVVDGEEEKMQGYSVRGDADIAMQQLGTIEEDKAYQDFSKVEKIYGIIKWNDDNTDGDAKEIVILYEKVDDEASFLNDM